MIQIYLAAQLVLFLAALATTGRSQGAWCVRAFLLGGEVALLSRLLPLIKEMGK